MKEKLSELKNRFENCDHLFVKVKEGETYYGFHSSDCGKTPPTVLCIKCGLTNKHIVMDPIKKYRYDQFLIFNNPYTYFKAQIHDEVFRKKYNHGYRRSGKSFDESVIPIVPNDDKKKVLTLAKN